MRRVSQHTWMVAHPGGDAVAGAPAAPGTAPARWRVLVADRDPEVHAAVDAALDGLPLLGRPVAVLHAWSADEARAVLMAGRGTAVLLMDQSLAAGAAWHELAGFVRASAELAHTRIVLRGDARAWPALDSLLRHDVSDCRDKADLAGERLVAIVATALRSLQQLCTIEANRHDQALLQRLTDYAYFDPLVRLPNRARFVEQVDECVRQGMNRHVLALVDIDDFSAANEVMGHRFGDCLLEMVAQCLARSLSPDVLLARVGPDTFGVLGSTGQVRPQQLVECVDQPLSIEGVPYKVSLTCGYVLLLQVDGRCGVDLVKDATIALKRAKRDHRGHYLQYLDDMGTEARARALLLSDLRSAIDQGLLFLVYQPQVDLHDGTLVGLEALARWRTREGAFVPPDQFIPVAEHSGLIVGLGRWVLATACQAMRRLLDAGCAPQRMAINVSMVQLRDPTFLSMVSLALANSGLQGRHIELEVTESVAVLPTQELERTLSALRAVGITIAIDDFGTGYSSLSCLERLPLDRMKIDRAFISQLGEPRGARIAEMVAQLGLKLDLQVLAEGIEDAATLRAAVAIGCHQGQGYHIARPMEEAGLLHWLQARAGRPAG
ncbi:EAL domain-containing protein [Xylophilus sp. Kf1]|nr:EAL domain-containing protein [Xylophilus sp. Kf1]